MRRGRSGILRRLEFFEIDRAVFLFFELLDFELGVFQSGFADLQQLGAFFEFGQELGKRNLTRFHRFDDGFEFSECPFEGKFGVFGVHERTRCAVDFGISNNLWATVLAEITAQIVSMGQRKPRPKCVVNFPFRSE
jgi:hypothetical protein